MRGETSGYLILGRRGPCVKRASPGEQHWRAALFLALVRKRLPASDFSALLRLHQAGGWCLFLEPPSGVRAKLWTAGVRAVLDEGLLELSADRMSTATLRQLAHLYGHLFEKQEETGN